MNKCAERAVACILFLILAVSCSSNGQKKPEINVSAMPDTYPVPGIPSTYSLPDQRFDFLMEHYWDNFHFKDTLTLQKPLFVKQAFADFVNILQTVPPDKSLKGISILMQKSRTDAKFLQTFLDLGETFLYDPNSPVRNETLYCRMLEAYLASPLVTDAWKIRPQKQYELAQKNTIGTKASDFSFELKNGSVSKLYEIQSKFILLYFHNPGCTDCKIEREKIKASTVFQSLQKDGVLKVVSIYPENNASEWEKHYLELPTSWINGYDKQAIIMKDEVYDLKAIPSMYLLDDQKRVLLKDARFEEIEAYVSKIVKKEL